MSSSVSTRVVVALAAAMLAQSLIAAPRNQQMVPLTELGDDTYYGFEGGLYPEGANVPPPVHAAAGLQRAQAVTPLDLFGDPDPNGRYVLLSIGMSNTTQEFCSASGSPPCDAWTFMGQAAADPRVNRSHLVIANGAKGGRAAAYWDSPTDPDYDRVRDEVLAPLGVSERQVQIVWLKVANPRPALSLPSSTADAYQLLASLGHIARALETRYPNLLQVFVSSRVYGGYATTALNPEPFAYESGFSVKWLIEAQIRQMLTGTIFLPPHDLHLDAAAPWLAWGPYLWADGSTPRSDGLFWEPRDFQSDGTHPSTSGEQKVGHLLLQFFVTSPFTRCWFGVEQTCL